MDIKNQKMIATKRFIELHKDNNIGNWHPTTMFNEDKKLLYIFDTIIATSNMEDDGMGNYMIEIGSHESRSGNPVIFEFNKNLIED